MTASSFVSGTPTDTNPGDASPTSPTPTVDRREAARSTVGHIHTRQHGGTHTGRST